MASSFPCLYSKQKLKKRKTFSDGRLSVNFATGLCCLYNAPDDRSTSTACLDSVTLTVPQLNRIRNGEELEIDFEQHIATVEQPPPPEKARPLLKVPKFVPPPKVAPAPKVVPDPPGPKTQHNTSNGIVKKGSGLYDVDDDVIDAFAEGDEREDVAPIIHQEEKFEAAVPEEDGADPWSDNEDENEAPLSAPPPPPTNANTNSQQGQVLESKKVLPQAQSQSQSQPENQDVWAEDNDNVIESPSGPVPALPAENEDDIWGF